MKKQRKMKTAWSDKELKILRREWQNGKPIKDWLHLLPKRTAQGVQKRAEELGLGRRENVSRAGRSISLALIRQLLSDGIPRSTLQMSQEIAVSRRAAAHAMREMHGKGFRVGDYGEQPEDGVRPCLWTLGDEPDAVRPPKTPKAERDRRRNRGFSGIPRPLANVRHIAPEMRDFLT